MNLFTVAIVAMLGAATAEKKVDLDNKVLNKHLMQKAKFIPPANDMATSDGNHNDERKLENNYYTSWMSNYSIKFAGCYSIPQFEREEGIRSNLIAKFHLCSNKESCRSCRDHGEYVIDMRDFIETYQEAQREANEYACETQQAECEYKCQVGAYDYGNDDGNANYYNQNGNDDNQDYCQYVCMNDAGMSYCDNDNGGEDMNFEELAECRSIYGDQGGNNNQNYYNNGGNGGSFQNYYVGAYCNSKGVFIGAFKDSMCSVKAPEGTYEKFYGYSLPQTSLVSTDCISCAGANENNGNNYNYNNNNNNNNNYNYNAGVSETCEQLYEDAGKCEKKLKGATYKNNQACELMHGTLARLDHAFRGGSFRAGPSTVFAWLFFVCVIGLAGYIYYLHTRVLKTEFNFTGTNFMNFGKGESA